MKKLILPILLLIATFFSGCSHTSIDNVIVESVALTGTNADHKYMITFRDDLFWFGQAYFYTDSLYQVGDTLK